MSESDAEKESGRNIVKVGQWFTPLVKLIQYPNEKRDDSRHWHYPFTVEDVGVFDMDISHSDNLYKILKETTLPGKPEDIKNLLILPNRVEIITNKNVDDWQKELETPILTYDGMSAESGPVVSWTFPQWRDSIRSPL